MYLQELSNPKISDCRESGSAVQHTVNSESQMLLLVSTFELFTFLAAGEFAAVASDLKEWSIQVQQTSCGFQWKREVRAGLPVLELIEPPVEGPPDAGDLLPPLPVQQLLGQHVAHQHIDLMDHTSYFTEHFLENRKVSLTDHRQQQQNPLTIVKCLLQFFSVILKITMFCSCCFSDRIHHPLYINPESLWTLLQ